LMVPLAAMAIVMDAVANIMAMDSFLNMVIFLTVCDQRLLGRDTRLRAEVAIRCALHAA
jgi:hypothetical protein